MICRNCGELMRVVMTRRYDTVVLRTRQCRKCGSRYCTEELEYSKPATTENEKGGAYALSADS
jgi:transcriptional regulator NrdR family protein